MLFRSTDCLLNSWPELTLYKVSVLEYSFCISITPQSTALIGQLVERSEMDTQPGPRKEMNYNDPQPGTDGKWVQEDLVCSGNNCDCSGTCESMIFTALFRLLEER